MKFEEFICSENEHTLRNNNHILQNIFKDWWEPFSIQYSNLNIRPVVFNEVQKFIGCGSKENGFSFYECNHCGNYLYVPFTCKSRFCPYCGVNSSLRVFDSMPSRFINVKHRHITFTIPNSLWPFFQKDRSLLHLLFKSASYTVLSWFKSWFKQQSKLDLFTPGIVATLHTFGRDLKWNTHIHMLVSEGAMGIHTPWKSFSHFPYLMLRKRFMTKLLFELSKHIHSSSFKALKNQLYHQRNNGFYVHAPSSKSSNFKIAISYITRYINRPAMAQSRITNYDPFSPSVTFFYDRHEDGKRVTETVHPFDLIKRLIIHIPDKGFNMTKYYGIYAMNKSKSRHLKRIKEKLTKPLKCSCGNTLTFQYFLVKSHSLLPQQKNSHLT